MKKITIFPFFLFYFYTLVNAQHQNDTLIINGQTDYIEYDDFELEYFLKNETGEKSFNPNLNFSFLIEPPLLLNNNGLMLSNNNRSSWFNNYNKSKNQYDNFLYFQNSNVDINLSNFNPPKMKKWELILNHSASFLIMGTGVMYNVNQYRNFKNENR